METSKWSNHHIIVTCHWGYIFWAHQWVPLGPRHILTSLVLLWYPQGRTECDYWDIPFKMWSSKVTAQSLQAPVMNRCGIYVSRSCWDHVVNMVKHVKMSSFNMFYHVISTWPTNINATSVHDGCLQGKFLAY